MLGSCFLKYLSGSEDFEMFAFAKDDLDVTDFEMLTALFKRISPDFVLNCAAYTDVDQCEVDRELAMKVNGEAPGVIARVCREEHAILVHFSTDYVFDGKNDSGYREDDEPSPINIYGESKLEGEKAVAKNMSDFYNIRTSWLFGENGKNFVDTMIRLGKEKTELSVVGDQIGSPTYTMDLCRGVVNHFLSPFLSGIPEHHERALPAEEGASKKLPFGNYHLTNSGSTSWYDYAKKIFELMEMDIFVKKVTSEEFKRPALRPANSLLLNTKVPGELRPWEEAVRAYLGLNYGM